MNLTGTTIYVAGPMSGKEFHNFPAFDACRDALRALGATVLSPADMTRQAAGLAPNELAAESDPRIKALTYSSCMSRDLAAVCASTGIVFLNGWSKSGGARIERALGILCNLDFLYWDGETLRLEPAAEDRYPAPIDLE